MDPSMGLDLKLHFVFGLCGERFADEPAGSSDFRTLIHFGLANLQSRLINVENIKEKEGDWCSATVRPRRTMRGEAGQASLDCWTREGGHRDVLVERGDVLRVKRALLERAHHAHRQGNESQGNLQAPSAPWGQRAESRAVAVHYIRATSLGRERVFPTVVSASQGPGGSEKASRRAGRQGARRCAVFALPTATGAAGAVARRRWARGGVR